MIVELFDCYNNQTLILNNPKIGGYALQAAVFITIINRFFLIWKDEKTVTGWRGGSKFETVLCGEPGFTPPDVKLNSQMM